MSSLKNIDSLLLNGSSNGISAQLLYPSVMPTVEDIGGVDDDYGKIEIYSEEGNTTPYEGPETIYIVSDKPGFRTDGLFTELSREYNAKLLHVENKKKLKKLDTPICFVIDVTTSLITGHARTLIDYLKKYAANRTIPIFLIGEPEDLSNVRQSIPFPPNIVLFEFERPIDIKACVSKSERTLIKDLSFEKERKRILVCDDSLTFLRLISRVLESEYEVVVTSSAFDCIGKLCTMPELPDAIVIDEQMPHCKGRQLCKILRGEERTKQIPIFFYTSNSDVDITIKLMPLINGYISKDKPVIELRKCLDDWFNNIKDEKDSKIKI